MRLAATQRSANRPGWSPGWAALLLVLGCHAPNPIYRGAVGEDGPAILTDETPGDSPDGGDPRNGDAHAGWSGGDAGPVVGAADAALVDGAGARPDAQAAADATGTTPEPPRDAGSAITDATVLPADAGPDPEPDAALVDSPTPPSSPWSYRIPLRVPRTRVGGPDTVSTALDDYPLLVSLKRSELRDQAHGGHVAHPAGFDLAFASESGALLAHEVEAYDPVSGTLFAWVKLPSLATIKGTQDTAFFLLYGDTAAQASRAQPASVWSAGFEAVYHLGDRPSLANPRVADSGPRGRHGRALGGVTADAAGKIAGALSFDGRQARVVTEDVLDGVDQITVQAWSLARSAVDRRILSKSDTYDQKATYLWSVGQDHGVLRGRVSTGGTAFKDLDADGTPFGTWYALAMTYDGKTIRLYRDGALVGQQERSGRINDGGSLVTIGNNGVTTLERAWDGLIDEVRLSAVVRSADWLRVDHQSQSAPGTFVTAGLEQLIR